MRVSILVFLLMALAGVGRGQSFSCLPPEINGKQIDKLKVHMPSSDVSVRQALIKIGAKCRKSRLVDRGRREIKFYFLQGCWGNPPADYLERLAAQRNEIKKLRKRFRVIEVACDVGNTPRRLISRVFFFKTAISI